VFLAVFNVCRAAVDGWTILSAFLSQRTLYNLRRWYQYGPMVLLLLIFFEPNIISSGSVIYPDTDWVSTQLLRL